MYRLVLKEEFREQSINWRKGDAASPLFCLSLTLLSSCWDEDNALRELKYQVSLMLTKYQRIAITQILPGELCKTLW